MRDRPDDRATAVGESGCYVCPGETKPITRAVHFSRLAAYYDACRHCEHRHDTGAMPRQVVERIDRVARRAEPRTPVTTFGLRGVYLNQLSRVTAQNYAAAYAHLIQNTTVEEGVSRDHAPTIVVGQDTRHSSPDIAAGVTAALRRRGCHVVDTSVTTLPCLRFAVDHLQATGGVFVSGYGHGPAYSGLDFLGPHVMPWSSPGRLDELIACASALPPRSGRRGGRHRSFAAEIPYAAGLWKHFHALRRLRVGVCLGSPPLRRLLNNLFEQLPCRLFWVDSLIGADTERMRRESIDALRAQITNQQCHAGLLIHDDGQTCEFFDESGRQMPLAAFVQPMIRTMSAEHSRIVCLVDQDAQQRCGIDRVAGTTIETTAAVEERFVNRFHEVSAHMGVDARGRIWFGESFPVCDAIVTLAKFLQLLSRSDAAASTLCAA